MDADISQKLNEVLSDPEKLSAVMGVVNSIMSSNEKSEESEEKHEESELPNTEALTKVMSVFSNKSDGKYGKDDRVKLLLALKPFLDEDRQERVDKLVRVFSLAGIAGQFKGFI